MQFLKIGLNLLVVVLGVLSSVSSHAVNECGAAVANSASCSAASYPLGINYTGAAGSGFTLNLNAPVSGTAVNGIVFASSLSPFSTTYNLTGPVTLTRTGPSNIVLGSAATTYGANMNLGAQSVITFNRTPGTNNFAAFYPVSVQSAGGPVNIVSAATITANANTGASGDRPFAVGISAVGNNGGAAETLNVSSSGLVTINHTSPNSLVGASAQGVVAYSIKPNTGTPSLVQTTNTSTGGIVVNNIGRGANCEGLVAINVGSGGTLATNAGSISILGDCEGNPASAGVSPQGGVGVVAVGGTGPATALINSGGSVNVNLNGANPGYARGVLISTGGLATVVADGDITVNGAALPQTAAIYVNDTSSVNLNPYTTIPAGSYQVTIKPRRTVSLLSPSPGTAIAALAPGGGTTDIQTGATVTNAAGAAGNAIITGIGPDVVNSSGTVLGTVTLGLGNDVFNLNGGSLTGDIYGDAGTAGASATDGNDIFNWNGGTWVGNFYGQNGSDTVNIASTAPWTGSNILDGGDDVSAVDGWVDVLNIQGQTVSTPAENLLNWERIELANNSNITLTGTTLTTGAGLNGAQVLGLIIDAGSTLKRAAPMLNVVGDILNQGTINLADGTPTLAALNLNGNYTGGGALNLDVVLNAGAGATSADQLIITGNSSASTTTLNITNVGGAGALTTGNGILLVSVSGASNATFVLPGSGYVSVNGYRYYLVKVGNNWYLQSSGALTVSKTLNGLNALTGTYNTPPVSFNVSATCDLPAANTRYPAMGFAVVTTAAPATLPVPAGANCTIAEDVASLPAPPVNFKWKTLAAGDYVQPGVIATAGSSASVTNTLTPLDPPFIKKSAKQIDATTVEWTITVINNSATNAGQAAVNYDVTDALPANMNFTSGSLTCTPTSASGNTLTPTACGFDGTVTHLSVSGTLAYTVGTDPATAVERVDIVFRGTTSPGTTVSNTACTNLTAQAANCSPPAVITLPQLVPTLDARSLALLVLILATAAMLARRKARW